MPKNALNIPFSFFCFLFFAERKIFMAQGGMGWGIYFSSRLCNFPSTIYKRCCPMVLFLFLFFVFLSKNWTSTCFASWLILVVAASRLALDLFREEKSRKTSGTRVRHGRPG